MNKIKIPETYNYISAFITMRCNLNCSFCLNALDKTKFNRNTLKKEMSGERWVEALNEIESRPEVPITFSGGEPFIHRDFIYILKNLKKELNIDILTNMYFNDEKIDKFISEINPERIKRNSLYSSIRVSYHPEQMNDTEKLIKNVKKLKNAGFSIGIWSVLYPSPKQLSAINQMQFKCKDNGIEFRVKEYTGKYLGELYGDYSKYSGAVFSKEVKKCLCKTHELLIGPKGNIYRCHRDLFSEEYSIGDITDKNFMLEDKFRNCDEYGQCHPCDVKIKTNYKQEIGNTSVEIKF